MTDQFSIQYISRLLDSPAMITEGDRTSVESLLRSYPYLVPLRYIEAAEKRTPHGFSTEMLAKARPYLGNWIKYCDFADAASQASVIIEPETEEYIQEEPVEIPEPTPIVLLAPEPVVRVSDEFLQLIREEAATINETPGIAPNPDFEAGSETTEANNETSSEYEIVEEVPQLASQPSVALHVVEPIGDERKKDTINNNITDEALISPIYTQDYFLQQGEKVSEEIPGEITELKESADDLDKSLMVMMSFSEWLLHFKSTTRKLEEEKKDQRALKTMWQKEKLAAALEEENEEIPENVFEMAVNSIAKEDGLASESLAEIYIKQGKYDKAMDMYRKLSLRNPQKNAYFARKIEEVLKEKQS